MIHIAAYLAAVSILAIFLAIRDKRAAKRNKWRTRESTLLLVAALGGIPAWQREWPELFGAVIDGQKILSSGYRREATGQGIGRIIIS